MTRSPNRPPNIGRRRPFRSRSPAERQADRLWLYGLHPVSAALANPRRTLLRLLVTDNARQRLDGLHDALSVPIEPATPRTLSKLLGEDAVHQGVALEVEPLTSPSLEELGASARLVLFLDQITDPHNVGAILRTAAAMDADAVIVTGRHSPTETGVLAKAASGALDIIPVVSVPNLARAMEEVRDSGFALIGLDSDGPEPLEDVLGHDKIALVLGAEGKGLRQKTQTTCDRLARLDLPGGIRSLNVSNAAALALYLAHRELAVRHKA